MNALNPSLLKEFHERKHLIYNLRIHKIPSFNSFLHLHTSQFKMTRERERERERERKREINSPRIQWFVSFSETPSHFLNCLLCVDCHVCSPIPLYSVPQCFSDLESKSWFIENALM